MRDESPASSAGDGCLEVLGETPTRSQPREGAFDQGQTVKLMSPEYVRPYVKAQKNNDRDAEAASRPTMRFVELKSEDQLDCQSLHRVRSAPSLLSYCRRNSPIAAAPSASASNGPT